MYWTCLDSMVGNKAISAVLSSFCSVASQMRTVFFQHACSGEKSQGPKALLVLPVSRVANPLLYRQAIRIDLIRQALQCTILGSAACEVSCLCAAHGYTAILMCVVEVCSLRSSSVRELGCNPCTFPHFQTVILEGARHWALGVLQGADL